jgi:hypothetical protein
MENSLYRIRRKSEMGALLVSIVLAISFTSLCSSIFAPNFGRASTQCTPIPAVFISLIFLLDFYPAYEQRLFTNGIQIFILNNQ